MASGRHHGTGRWCLGHDVAGQAPSLQHGHYIPEPEWVDELFTRRNGEASRSKGFAPTLEPRCTICRSIRNHHHHYENAVIRARQFRRKHADRWAKKLDTTPEAMLREMDNGGVAEQAITEVILAHIGQSCPGYCIYEKDGRLHRHTIDRVQDLEVDVKNPDDPFTIENIGILCIPCNRAKGDRPWGRFIYARRCAFHAWQAAIDNPRYRRGEQLQFDLV